MLVLDLISISSCSLLALGQINPMEAGEKLGSLPATAILGTLCILSLVVNRMLYKDRAKDLEKLREDNSVHTEKLYNMIEANTKASQAAVDAMNANTAITVEMKKEVILCSGKDRS